MTSKRPFVYIESNNGKFTNLFLKLEDVNGIKFTSVFSDSSYSIFLVDLSSDITSLSEAVLDLLQRCREKQIKVAVCLLFNDRVDIEKVMFFRNLLESQKTSSPLYRLCLVKDLYQDVISKPLTFFDDLLFQSLHESQWNISKNGKTLFFPLYINDFIAALTKILFLDSTAGKSFWIFGDR